MAQRFRETPIGETERLTRELTEAEIKEHAQMLAAVIDRYNQVEREKKSAMADYTELLKELRGDMNRLGREVKSGRIPV
jgi:uncharacterized protein (UPF0335 family)